MAIPIARAKNHIAAGVWIAAPDSYRDDESPTANTLFHKLKFDLHIAFQMVYEIATSQKGICSIALAVRYGVQ